MRSGKSEKSYLYRLLGPEDWAGLLPFWIAPTQPHTPPPPNMSHPPMSTPSLPSLLSLPAAPIFAHSSSPLPMVAISKSTNKHCPLLLFAHCLCPSLFSLQLVLLVAMLCKVLRITWAESCWRQIVGFDCLFSVIVTLACSCVCLAAQQLCYLDTGHLEL